MNIFLKLRHWQLFLLIIGIPVVFEILIMQQMIAHNGFGAGFFIYFPLMMVLFIGVFYGWLYTIGTSLQKKLPETVKMNVTLFRWFFFIPTVYILFICTVIFSVSRFHFGFMPNPFIVLAIIPIHLFSMFCIFYCLYFISKSLKSVEMQRPVTFSDYAGEFFLIWFFPIGIWLIQPRINKMFGS